MFHAIFARKYDDKEPYCVLNSSDWKKVEQHYEEIIGPGKIGTAFREAHAELSVIKDGEKFAHHQFESQKSQLLIEAQRIVQEHRAAEATLAAAQKRFDQATAALGSLSDLHRRLLNEK